VNLCPKVVNAAKSLLYGRKGEPYSFAGRKLYFVPGTRPIRLSHVNSPNAVNRYDALQIAWIDKHTKTGDIVLDIGAHAGCYSLIIAAKCGLSGRVIAFEPDPYARFAFMKNTALNPNLKSPVLESIACFDSDGQAVLYCGHGNANSSLARSSAKSVDELRVTTTTLDSYVAERNLNPKIVKIDAEGAEIRILKGAKRLLAGDAQIICELHPYAWKEFGNTFEELKELIKLAGRCARYLDFDAEFSEAKYGAVELTIAPRRAT
jgi:FkbM family methyltransferase